jgi:hypothetical protein
MAPPHPGFAALNPGYGAIPVTYGIADPVMTKRGTAKFQSSP